MLIHPPPLATGCRPIWYDQKQLGLPWEALHTSPFVIMFAHIRIPYELYFVYILKSRCVRKGCSRNYPQGGAHFFRPLNLQDKHGVRAPPTPRTRKCFNEPAPLWIKYALTPRTSYPTPPHPSDTLSTKHPSPPTGQKKVPAPTPPG